KGLTIGLRQLAPIGACLLQQGKRSVHVSLNKIFRPADGTIYMALGGEMNDRCRPVLDERSPNKLTICNVSANKLVSRMLRDRFQVMQIPRVGELVKIDD